MTTLGGPRSGTTAPTAPSVQMDDEIGGSSTSASASRSRRESQSVDDVKAMSTSPASSQKRKEKNRRKKEKRKKKEERRKEEEAYLANVEDDCTDSDDDDSESSEDYRVGGYHRVKIGDSFRSGRYIVVQKAGWGHFSTVWITRDNWKSADHEDAYVALKIQKSGKSYCEAAVDEISMCKTVSDGDPEGKKHVTRLLDNFKITGPNGTHYCMVFELLGENLLTLIRRFTKISQMPPAPLLKSIIHQVLVGLDYLHTECHLIHTDLKPENVLIKPPYKYVPPAERAAAGLVDQLSGTDFEIGGGSGSGGGGGSRSNEEAIASASRDREDENVSPDRRMDMDDADDAKSKSKGEMHGPIFPSGSKKPDRYRTLSVYHYTPKVSVYLADLGNACKINHHYTEDIQTRQYRSPEVILGQGYSAVTDMWSAACMFFELATNDYLFHPHANQNFSRDEDHLALFIETLGPFPYYLTQKGRLAHEFFRRNDGQLRNIHELKFWSLENVLKEKYKWSDRDAKQFASFLLPMLEYDPRNRATPAKSLQHEYLKGI